MDVREAVRRVPTRLVPGALAAAAGAVVWIATSRHGAGVTPDSVAYVSVARSLLAGEGFTLWTGAPLVDWPPLYPALLAAAGGFTGVDPLAVSRAVQAGLAMVVVVLSWALLERHLRVRGPWLALAGAAFVTAPSLVKVARMAWSESLFVALVLGTVLALEGYVERPRRTMLLAAAVLAALACLTRYIGVTLLLAGALVLLVRHRRDPGEGLWATTVFGAIAAWPLSLWLVRNAALTGLPLGARRASDTTLAEATFLAAGTFGEWLFGAAPAAGALLAAIAGAALLGALALAGERPRRPAGGAPSLLPLAAVFTAYVGFLIVSATRTAFDPIGHRLLAPVHPLLLVAVLVVAASLVAPLASRSARVPLRAAAAVLLATWLSVPSALLARDLAEWTRDGAGGFARDAWLESETLARLRDDPRLRRLPVHSNAPDLCYVLAGVPAALAPTRASFGSGGGGLTATEDGWPARDGWLVWFDRMKRAYVLPPDELAARAPLETVHRLGDGAVYAVRAASPGESRPEPLAGRSRPRPGG